MKRLIKIGLWVIAILSLIIIIAIYFFLSYDFYKSDTELRAELVNLDIPGLIKYNYQGGDSLRYVHIPNENTNAPVLIMLHGAPGSCEDYLTYWNNKDLISHYEVVAIDRPGYGESNREDYNIEIADQASQILVLIQSIAKKRKVAILSHSYGGPIGGQVAVQLDTICIGHVMIAPVIDPYSEKVFWYASIPTTWPFSLFSSDDWKMATLEKTSHINQLKELIPTWVNIKSKTIHVHGTADRLASKDNIVFCSKSFDSQYYCSIIIDEGSHFILWDDEIKEVIVNNLLDLVGD